MRYRIIGWICENGKSSVRVSSPIPSASGSSASSRSTSGTTVGSKWKASQAAQRVAPPISSERLNRSRSSAPPQASSRVRR